MPGVTAMFSKLLIANRGEIACRVMRTARRMGIATVAIYSDADAAALHVAEADEAYRVGPPPPRASYLNVAAILDAARRSGAQAVHPGYGFLSENAEFAEACAEAGLVFVGPPPAAIRAMGGKSEAKALMERAGVPLVPGYHGAAQDAAILTAEAARIGYPVLIKASAGGGGKGMRVVTDPAHLAAEIEGAKREAASAFGDDRVLIERYLQHPRHIEIQVFADTHGNVVSLFERDCSVQRRHQKIIEEAPAPGMAPEMRRAMGEAAIAAARAVGYVGAGTVEFIVEGGDFHFMEMNTRLQVEHPVTEMITGFDLVEWQLRVAAGEALPSLAPGIDGHAFEARIYAEDPARDFLPSVGTIAHLRAPVAGEGVRVDTGVRAGDRISVDYDPMIAKLIVHGADRDAALRRLRAALASYEVVGVQTNLGLLRALAAHPAFAAGEVETGFIPLHPEVLATGGADATLAIAAVALAVADDRALAGGNDSGSPWAAADSWRMNLPGWQTILLRHGEAVLSIAARHEADGVARLTWDGHDGPVRRIATGVGRTAIQLSDRSGDVAIIRDGGDRVIAVCDGINHVFDLIDPLAPPEAAAGGGGKVVAPIPGRIASVLVTAGDAVTRGQKLVVLEAMKMELALSAPADGIVGAVRCAVGDMVEEGRELVVMAAEADGRA
jgi:3-methylcrotonyl-CoA carboxylase alpha subunit